LGRKRKKAKKGGVKKGKVGGRGKKVLRVGGKRGKRKKNGRPGERTTGGGKIDVYKTDFKGRRRKRKERGCWVKEQMGLKGGGKNKRGVGKKLQTKEGEGLIQRGEKVKVKLGGNKK